MHLIIVVFGPVNQWLMSCTLQSPVLLPGLISPQHLSHMSLISAALFPVSLHLHLSPLVSLVCI